MKLIVCIKQVPDTTEVKLDPKTGTLIRDGVPSIINPDDRAALEVALKMKDANLGTTVTVICMGPKQADAAVREALAMGADSAIIVSDRAFAGSDTWATANVISSAIQKIMDYDLVFCGRQAIDGDTAQVGPQIAERLNIPQVTYARSVKVLGDSRYEVCRELDDEQQVVEVTGPALITVVHGLEPIRYPDFRRIFQAYSGVFEVLNWSQEELKIDANKIGLKSSPTNVKCTFPPELRKSGIRLEGTNEEMVKQLFDNMLGEHILKRRA